MFLVGPREGELDSQALSALGDAALDARKFEEAFDYYKRAADGGNANVSRAVSAFETKSRFSIVCERLSLISINRARFRLRCRSVRS